MLNASHNVGPGGGGKERGNIPSIEGDEMADTYETFSILLPPDFCLPCFSSSGSSRSRGE